MSGTRKTMKRWMGMISSSGGVIARNSNKMEKISLFPVNRSFLPGEYFQNSSLTQAFIVQ